jgi:kynurenine formamidase
MSKVFSIRQLLSWALAVGMVFLIGCQKESNSDSFQPKAIIDLGALVTEDLAFRVWGADNLAANGIDRRNVFDLVKNDLDIDDGQSITTVNSFYTLANHGGPHVDAPVHVDLGPGLDGYGVETFVGPLKVFDVREYPTGRTVPKDVFVGKGIRPGDIVLIYTGWQPPGDGFDVITLTLDAAEYLAEIPVGAFGTDALSVYDADFPPPENPDPHVRAIPIHHTFLSRQIPIYEQLFNVDQTLGHDRMYFVGAPLNIKDGDGMIVRPLVFVY